MLELKGRADCESANALALCSVQTGDTKQMCRCCCVLAGVVVVASAARMFELVVGLPTRAGGMGHALLGPIVLQQ